VGVVNERCEEEEEEEAQERLVIFDTIRFLFFFI